METHPLPSLSAKELIRFWNRVDRGEEHWIWTGKISGSTRWPCYSLQGVAYSARRIAWEFAGTRRRRLTVKKPNLQVTCGEHLCVNPAHLMPVARGGHPRREKCSRGHAFTPDNVYMTSQGKRACRQCIHIKTQERRLRYLKEGRGWGRNYKPSSSPIGDKKPVTLSRSRKR